jgi:hypothetical protein
MRYANSSLRIPFLGLYGTSFFGVEDENFVERETSSPIEDQVCFSIILK